MARVARKNVYLLLNYPLKVLPYLSIWPLNLNPVILLEALPDMQPGSRRAV